MSAADLPASCQLDRLTDDWLTAVAAYRNEDADGVAYAFSPPGLGEVETYTRLCGLIILAAECCGLEYRKTNPPGPFGFYSVRIENVITGDSVNPDDSVEDANVVAAARLITASANRDGDMLHDLVRAHMPFEGEIERSGVLLDLLAIYCALTEEVTSDGQ